MKCTEPARLAGTDQVVDLTARKDPGVEPMLACDVEPLFEFGQFPVAAREIQYALLCESQVLPDLPVRSRLLV